MTQLSILDETPFYAESGGQVGDTGVITIGESRFAVTDTKKTANGSVPPLRYS